MTSWQAKDHRVRLLGQFLAFGGIGVIGFLVDTATLYTAAGLGTGLYLGRVCSYLVAVTVTWALNRRFTFGRAGRGPLWRQWAAFGTSQLGGASINLGAYSVLVTMSPLVAKWPVIGVAVGSILGLFANFALARRYVFRDRPDAVFMEGSQPSLRADRRELVFLRRMALMAAIGVVTTASLCWSAFLNGQPFFFADTTAYVRGVDVAVQKALGVTTVWSNADGSDDGGQAVQAAAPQPAASLSSVKQNAVLAGRSVYYGALLYAGHMAGGFWLTVFVQALFVAACIFLTLKTFFGEGFVRTVVAIGVLAVVTPVSFFTAYLMPDIFAGIAILACVNLLVFGPRLRGAELAFWFVVLSLALTFHSSHLLIGVAFAVLGLALAAFLGGKGRWLASAVLFAAILTAILAEGVFNLAVTKIVGSPPIRPPFLMARVIEDGPGYAYLKQACRDNRYAVCAFADRLPMSSDDFLWNPDPKGGVFATADAPTRRALSAEQMAFLAGVMAFDPFGQLAVSLSNGFKQLGLFGLTEFNYSGGTRRYFAAKLPSLYLDPMKQTLAYKEAMPTAPLSWLIYATVFVSLGFIVSAHLIGGKAVARTAVPPEMLGFMALIVTGIVLNAMICGALSSPHDRYEARVIWLVPFVALIYDFYRRSEWWARVLAGARAPQPDPVAGRQFSR